MGWTFTHATKYKPNNFWKPDIKAECDKLYGDDLVKSAMYGSTYYAAVRGKDGEVWCAVVLTHTRTKDFCNFGYKVMSEDCGPRVYECPVSILNLLTPTKNKYANEWRETCRKKHASRKKAKKQGIASLPVGAMFKTKDTKGEEVLVQKMAPNHQFKRNWYWICGTRNYMPVSRIGEFEVVVKREGRHHAGNQ